MRCGCTVRRASAPVPGWMATVKLCVSSSTFGPFRVTSIVAVPWPAAVTGMVMPSLALASSRTVDAQGIRRHDDGTADVEIDRVVARRPLHIVDLHEEARAVADGEEPRKRAGQHDGIANDHVGARAADAVLRPGDRHDPHRAVEGGNVEIHVRRIRPPPPSPRRRSAPAAPASAGCRRGPSAPCRRPSGSRRVCPACRR